MKFVYIIFATIVVSAVGIFGFGTDASTCENENGPSRIVIIQGKAVFSELDGEKSIPASSETIVFQKIGCESCFVAAHPDAEGKYKILVGDGKYRVIVKNPSTPNSDLLMPGQQRIIDTQSEEAKKLSKQVFELDLELRAPQ